MGPTRTEEPNIPTSHRNSGHKKKHRSRHSERDHNSLPGVQKLKAALRQTHRLLAKDNLAADVRVETERRLKSLEADLMRAGLAKKERALAIKYHKAKFFERQKVARKINQVKRQLCSRDTSSTSRRGQEKQLEELRIDLNYILHFPKNKKYISLFPPEIRKGDTDTSISPSSNMTKTDVERQRIRDYIRGAMHKGELSQEPELDLHAEKVRFTNQLTSKFSEEGQPKQQSKKAAQGITTPELPEDTFFGDDDDEDSDEHEGDEPSE